VLREQIVEHLRGRVYEMVRERVARDVAAQVAQELEEQIPMTLRDEVKDHKRELEEVRRSLHNSEARRANANLRSSNLHEPLRPLLRTNGQPCTIFPRDLASLFGQNSAAARQLVLEYDIEPSETREANLNKFMAHIGVAFQLIPASSASDSVSIPLLSSYPS